jgi:hypothetical protein
MALNEASASRSGGDRKAGGGAMLFWSLVILAILILAFVLFASGAQAVDTGSGMRPQGGTGGAAAVGTEATIEEVTENPQQYEGNNVTVTGNLEEVVSPTAIRITSGGFLGIGQDDILVIGQQAFPPGVSERREELSLQVTGPVQLFNRVEFENDWGINLDDELFTVYEGRPVIVAQSLAMAPATEGGDQLGAATGQEGVDIVPEGGAAGGAAEIDTASDLARITENTEAYYGDTVNVSGFVAKIVDSNAFSISPTPGVSGDGILVVAQPENIPLITVGDEVQIKGQVRSFDLRQYENELGLDLDDVLLGDWDQDPSLKAFSIQPAESPTAGGPQGRGTGGAGGGAVDTAADTVIIDTILRR